MDNRKTYKIKVLVTKNDNSWEDMIIFKTDKNIDVLSNYERCLAILYGYDKLKMLKIEEEEYLETIN